MNFENLKKLKDDKFYRYFGIKRFHFDEMLEKLIKIEKAFIPLCTIFKFYHINGDKSLPRKLSPHVFKSNTKLQFQN